MSDIKCSYMTKRSNGWSDEYYCTKVEHAVPYDQYISKCCSYSYSDCSNYKYEKPSSGCFITTVVCDILGMDDSNFYLTMLRKFRKEYLQVRPDGLSILEQYDTVGPIIAHCIMNDENREEVAMKAFTNSIVPVVNDVCEYKSVSAIRKYADMTNGLIHRYGLDALSISIPGVSIYDYTDDRSMMGHGNLVKKR